MKRFLLIPVALFAVGCGSTETAPDSQPDSAAPAPSAKETQIFIFQGKIAVKKTELASADAELAQINSERAELAGKPASQTKTNRLAQLIRIETDTKRKKESVRQEIATLDAQLKDLTMETKSADDALDFALAGEENRRKQAADRKRLTAESKMKEEQRRIAEAERARKALEARMKREAVQGGRTTGENALFEEAWADVILFVRAELQRFKRW